MLDVLVHISSRIGEKWKLLRIFAVSPTCPA